MDSFRSLYLEYCKTYNVEPQEVIKSEIKRYIKYFILSSKTLLFSHIVFVEIDLV